MIILQHITLPTSFDALLSVLPVPAFLVLNELQHHSCNQEMFRSQSSCETLRRIAPAKQAVAHHYGTYVGGFAKPVLSERLDTGARVQKKMNGSPEPNAGSIVCRLGRGFNKEASGWLQSFASGWNTVREGKQ
jgi:hypothetical protein